MIARRDDLDAYLATVVRKLVDRLAAQESASTDLLAKIEIAARLNRAIEEHLERLIVRADRDLAVDVQSGPPKRPTWKEIGQSLGISAQAAHRKYGPAVREYLKDLQRIRANRLDASGRAPASG